MSSTISKVALAWLAALLVAFGSAWDLMDRDDDRQSKVTEVSHACETDLGALTTRESSECAKRRFENSDVADVVSVALCDAYDPRIEREVSVDRFPLRSELSKGVSFFVVLRLTV